MIELSDHGPIGFSRRICIVNNILVHNCINVLRDYFTRYFHSGHTNCNKLGCQSASSQHTYFLDERAEKSLCAIGTISRRAICKQILVTFLCVVQFHFLEKDRSYPADTRKAERLGTPSETNPVACKCAQSFTTNQARVASTQVGSWFCAEACTCFQVHLILSEHGFFIAPTLNKVWQCSQPGEVQKYLQFCKA